MAITVENLIEELQKLPQDLEVYCEDIESFLLGSVWSVEIRENLAVLKGY